MNSSKFVGFRSIRDSPAVLWSQAVLGLAEACEWTSGAADAAPRGRVSHLLDLNKAVEEENTLGSQNEFRSWIFKDFQDFDSFWATQDCLLLLPL